MVRWISQLAVLAATGSVPAGCVMIDHSGRSLEGAAPEAMTLTEPPVRYFLAGEPTDRRVIFVHGTPGAASNFKRYLVSPIPGIESVAVDRLGWGKSDPAHVEPSLAAQAAALEPLLEIREGPDGKPLKPILVGHSLGGPIVVRAAIDFPDRVGGLVIVAGSLDPELEKVLFIQRVGEFGLTPLLLPRWVRNTNRELLPLKAELETLSEQLGEITCPVLIVHGTKDGLVPFENVEFMRDRFTSAPVETLIFEGAGHMLPWTHEPQLRQSIAEMAGVATTAESK
jgi:pimeloyl-ACP methyl ester carboxylesterase